MIAIPDTSSPQKKRRKLKFRINGLETDVAAVTEDGKRFPEYCKSYVSLLCYYHQESFAQNDVNCPLLLKKRPIDIDDIVKEKTDFLFLFQKEFDV